MRSRIFGVALVVSSLLFLGEPAHADTIKVGGLAGFNFSSPSVTANNVAVSTSGKTLFTFGASVQFPLFPMFQLEIDAMYLSHGYTQGTTDVTFKQLHIPAIIRFTALPIISFGAGLYYSNALGNITVTTANVSSDFDYDASFRKKNDIGLVASVAAGFPIAPLIDIFADLRYQVGLVNQVTDPTKPNDSLKFNGLLALAGIKVGF